MRAGDYTVTLANGKETILAGIPNLSNVTKWTQIRHIRVNAVELHDSAGELNVRSMFYDINFML